MLGPMDRRAEARRRARASWTIRIFRPGDEALAEQADLAFWDEIPIDERAGVVWKLSQEVFSLSPQDSHDRPRLSRSIVRIVRR